MKISRAQSDMTKLVEASQIPAVTTVMGKGSVPTNHELYYGNVGMHGNWAANNAVNHCDMLISIGTRFNDRITGKLGTFAPEAKIIHIDIDTAYYNVIATHIKECAVFILFVSNHSMTREYVTGNELGYANRLGKPILPLFIEKNVELPPEQLATEYPRVKALLDVFVRG